MVIPARIRELMHLDTADSLALELTLDGLTIRPVHAGRDPRQWWYWSRSWGPSDRDEDEAGTGPMSAAEFDELLDGIDRELERESGD